MISVDSDTSTGAHRTGLFKSQSMNTLFTESTSTHFANKEVVSIKQVLDEPTWKHESRLHQMGYEPQYPPNLEMENLRNQMQSCLYLGASMKWFLT